MSGELFPRDVFRHLRGYTGPNAYGAVLRPWVEDCGSGLRDLMAPLTSYGAWRRAMYVFGDLLEQAYALSRVSRPYHRRSSGRRPMSFILKPAGRRSPSTSTSTCSRDWGCRQSRPGPSTPFFHEIVAVEQTEDADHPIEIV